MEKLIPERMVHYTLWAVWWLIVGASAIWLLVGSVAYWVSKGWLPDDSAGWAQALGAFVAIIVALALPYYQSRKQNLERAEEEFRKRLESFNAVYALMNHLHGLFKRLAVYGIPQTVVSAYPKKNPLSHELIQAAAMLREIPVISISNEMVHFMVGLREVATYGEYAGKLLEDAFFGVDNLSTLRLRALANTELINRWMEELDALELEVRRRGL